MALGDDPTPKYSAYNQQSAKFQRPDPPSTGEMMTRGDVIELIQKNMENTVPGLAIDAVARELNVTGPSVSQDGLQVAIGTLGPNGASSPGTGTIPDVIIAVDGVLKYYDIQGRYVSDVP
jgi:hypothetical protein